jgi:hypothetical protein
MDQKSPNKNIFIIGTIALLVLVGVVFLNRNNLLFGSKTSFGLETTSSQLQKGETFTVSVTLPNENSNDVTAYDVQIDFDKSKVKLISAKPGGFFVNPMVVKWDIDNAWFSAAASPTGYKETVDRVDATKPLLTLEFTALEAADEGNITIKKDSQIYVYQKGSSMPEVAQIEFSIQ